MLIFEIRGSIREENKKVKWNELLTKIDLWKSTYALNFCLSFFHSTFLKAKVHKLILTYGKAQRILVSAQLLDLVPLHLIGLTGTKLWGG